MQKCIRCCDNSTGKLPRKVEGLGEEHVQDVSWPDEKGGVEDASAALKATAVSHCR